jgi:hypothetical protein
MTSKLHVPIVLRGNTGEVYDPGDSWSGSRALLMELATGAARRERWDERWLLQVVVALATIDLSAEAEHRTDCFTIGMCETLSRLLSCWQEYHCRGYSDSGRHVRLSVDDEELTRLCQFLFGCDGFTVERVEMT